MRHYRALEELPPGDGPRAVAIGAFDGVHLGHREIIRRAVAAGADRGIAAMVITFAPNPLEVLRPELKTTSLSDPDLRARLIAALGVDELLEIPFTPEFSRIPWQRFCAMLTEPPIGAQMISVGRNFRFGHGGEGTTTMLRHHGLSRDVAVEVPPLVCSGDGKPISSTRIRRLIAQGDVDEAAMLLGRAHCVVGTVVHGDGRGTGLGIPTANIDVDERSAVPGRGVYAGQVRVDGRWWAAAINVGRAPTFRDAGDVRVEALLLDYDGPDIYGESLCAGFIRRLRNEMHFASPEALVRQIQRDVADARTAAEGADSPVC